MTTDAGPDTGKVALPRTERPDAPAYLQRYKERQARGSAPQVEHGDEGDTTPLYLRRFRERREEENALEAPVPLWEGAELNATRAWAEVTRTREIVPESKEQAKTAVTDIYFVRHGETQGYSTESGLTPLGSWQAHRRGQEFARRVMTGHHVTMACADTNRARQTAEHIRRGLLDQLVLFGRDATVGEVTPYEEFRNFQVATPDGFRDVTQAFRLYHSTMETYERHGQGGRPTWLVEVDRFWGIQQAGGDPITHWLTMPMLTFEPPVAAVRRFWAGLMRIHHENHGQTVVVATHSGPIRAFATWALGYDPGEPFNTEFVRVRLLEDGQSALVLYRNRVQEVAVPDFDGLPDWWAGLEGRALPINRREGTPA
ncbi:MAG: histidine phosphatase family protein [Candidatus Nanopelagicales bacterium]